MSDSFNNLPNLPNDKDVESEVTPQSENPFNLTPEEEKTLDLQIYQKAYAFAQYQLSFQAKTLATMYVNLVNFPEDKKAEYSHHWTHNLEEKAWSSIAKFIQDKVDADIEKYNKANTKEERQKLIKELIAEITPFVEEEINKRAERGVIDARKSRQEQRKNYDDYFSNKKIRDAIFNKGWFTYQCIVNIWDKYQDEIRNDPEFDFTNIQNQEEFDKYLKASRDITVNPIINELSQYLRNLLLDGGGNSFRLVDIFQNLGVNIPENLMISDIHIRGNNIWLDRADVMNMYEIPLQCLLCPEELREDFVKFMVSSMDTQEGRTYLHSFLILSEITHIVIQRFINERRLSS